MSKLHCIFESYDYFKTSCSHNLLVCWGASAISSHLILPGTFIFLCRYLVYNLFSQKQVSENKVNMNFHVCSVAYHMFNPISSIDYYCFRPYLDGPLIDRFSFSTFDFSDAPCAHVVGI